MPIIRDCSYMLSLSSPSPVSALYPATPYNDASSLSDKSIRYHRLPSIILRTPEFAYSRHRSKSIGGFLSSSITENDRLPISLPSGPCPWLRAMSSVVVSDKQDAAVAVLRGKR